MLSLYLVPGHVNLIKLCENKNELEIEGEEAHHMSVARHKVGDQIWISNGLGQRAIATLTSVEKNKVRLSINEAKYLSPRPIRLRAIQALTKSDRADECIELLVEAGVDEIIPWQAGRSIGKWQDNATKARWEGWVRAAVKQSRRNQIPIVLDIERSLGNLISRLHLQDGQDGLIFIFDENATKSLQQDFEKNFSATVLTIIIGPEGGITDQELAEAIKAGAMPIKLGQPILRSAHAGAIALAAIQSTYGLWE